MSTAAQAARMRFHRYVAVLFATAVPLVAIVEIARALQGMSQAWMRLAAPALLTVWSVRVARSERPNSLPLVLSTMFYCGAVVLLESLFDVDITSFDYATAFGLMMLFAVLSGTLITGSKLVWSGSLAAGLAAWVVVIGVATGDTPEAMAVRAVVAVAGVIFTTALVAEMFDQLNEAATAYNQSRRLQEAVAHCSEALLVHPDSFALNEAVRAIFEATDADYAYVDVTTDVEGEPGWEIVASATHGDDVGEDWQTGRYSAIPSTYEALRRGEAAVVYTKDLDGDERTHYEADQILSEISVPVFVEDEFRGSIGFVQYTSWRRWSDDEIQTLWRAADMVGSYWRRQDDAEALKASNESKDKLLASVSHEIRTPLTAIVGLSEEIVSADPVLSADEMRDLNGIIAVQSRELAELVEDLLVASRADFGNLSIRAESIDLSSQIDRVVEGLRESAPGSKTIAFDGPARSAWADPLRVRQILRNLVTNAIKYGGDQVDISVGERDGAVCVLVADDGPGVSEAEVGLIFERYYRSAQSPTQPGSVGIGLAVSRQLAQMMGGTLDYVTRGSVHGFELMLPMAAQAEKLLVPEPA